MRAGPKGQVTAPPLDFKGWPRARAPRRIRFIGRYVVTPRGIGARKPLKLRAFQRAIVEGAFAPGVRTAVVSVPRSNGKTCLAAALGLSELFVGPPSAETLVVASDQRQAEITLKLARRMVELHPELEARVQVFRDRLYLPQNDAVLLPLPAEPDALHGHDPSLLVLDELHVVTREVFEAATTAAGKRAESLTLAISTPASSPDCVMWDLVEHGRADTDPAFFLAEWAAPDGCDINDRQAWRIANPALADPRPFMAEDALAAVARTTREATFRQLRLGQWVSASGAWLPHGAWDGLAAPGRAVPDGAEVVLGFDGSYSGDSTALVAATVEARPHVFVVGAWENPNDPSWRVPRAEVDACVTDAFRRWRVRRLAADPWGWRSEIEEWERRFGAEVVLEWPSNSLRRMGPACDGFYTAVMEQALSHDGDPRLGRHLAHAHVKSTAVGAVVVKDARGSPRKIDLAVAAVIAFDALRGLPAPRRRRRVYAF